MNALLMCGGRGLRLGRGEKPLFKVCGVRLIEHSLAEFENFDALAVTSPHTPETEKFLRELGVEYYRASGRGFIEDYIEVCIELSICEPVFVACTDIVYLDHGIPDRMVEYYLKSTKRALKAVMNGEAVGLNIIDALFIYHEQEEEIYNLRRNCIVNVNTLRDAARAEELWMFMRKKGAGLLRD